MTTQGFYDRIAFEPNTGCWLWFGRLNRDGYGSLHPENNEFGTYNAHRFSYLMHKGGIPSDKEVMHICDVRNCVNPDHLMLGTHADNIRDMDMKNRRVVSRGEKMGRSKLKPDQVEQIKQMYVTGKFKQIEIAAKFGVERCVVSAITNRKTWRHLNDDRPYKPVKFKKDKIFSELECEVIQKCISDGLSSKRLAEYFNVSSPTIYRIRDNQYL